MSETLQNKHMLMFSLIFGELHTKEQKQQEAELESTQLLARSDCHTCNPRFGERSNGALRLAWAIK